MRRNLYGLFIDFSTAYNTILHTKLYKDLERVLEKEEIQLIKAIYSRNKIKLGDQSFKPNIGVAQGSIISPFLFNIYCENLYNQLIQEESINKEDLLGYADDILVLCTSIIQLKKVIKRIKEWSSTNNLKLNTKNQESLNLNQELEKQQNDLQ